MTLDRALRTAFNALTYPVSTEIDPRGYSLRIDRDEVRFAAETLADALASRPSAIVEEPTAWAVTSLSGMHVGLWSDEITARSAAADYRGSTVKPLYASPQPHTGRAGVTEAMVEAACKVYEPLLFHAEKHIAHRAASPHSVHAAREKTRAILRNALNAALTVEPEAPTHQHVKRGSTYTLIGFGKMQAENWVVLNPSPKWEAGTKFKLHGYHGTAADMQEVAIYRSTEDGSLWVRPREEFEDGRFIELPAKVAP